MERQSNLIVTLALMDLERAVRFDNWANLQTPATLKKAMRPRKPSKSWLISWP
jgi:hypothetical protein